MWVYDNRVTTRKTLSEVPKRKGWGSCGSLVCQGTQKRYGKAFSTKGESVKEEDLGSAVVQSVVDIARTGGQTPPLPSPCYKIYR